MNQCKMTNIVTRKICQRKISGLSVHGCCEKQARKCTLGPNMIDDFSNNYFSKWGKQWRYLSRSEIFPEVSFPKNNIVAVCK